MKRLVAALMMLSPALTWAQSSDSPACEQAEKALGHVWATTLNHVRQVRLGLLQDIIRDADVARRQNDDYEDIYGEIHAMAQFAMVALKIPDLCAAIHDGDGYGALPLPIMAGIDDVQITLDCRHPWHDPNDEPNELKAKWDLEYILRDTIDLDDIVAGTRCQGHFPEGPTKALRERMYKNANHLILILMFLHSQDWNSEVSPTSYAIRALRPYIQELLTPFTKAQMRTDKICYSDD